MSELRVMVAVPSNGSWSDRTGLSLINLVADFSRKFDGYDEQQLMFRSRRGSILPQSREKLVESAIESDATHLLFVDADQRFPHYTLRQLLLWQKPVVACNIATKRFPSSSTARGRVKTGGQQKMYNGKPIYTREGMIGLEQVWRVGTGIMLIDMEVFRQIERPWFPMEYLKEIHEWVGEDWGFCKRCELFGIPIYIDHGLSWEVGHIGDCDYTHDLVFDPGESPRKWGLEKKMDPCIA